MTKWLLALAFVLPASFGSAQEFRMNTIQADILPRPDGLILQYSFPLGPGLQQGWWPTEQVAKFDFGDWANTLQYQTSKGATELWLQDSHDVCGPKEAPAGVCTYLGTFYYGPVISEYTLPDGSEYASVFGELTGTFTDVFGNIYSNVSAVFEDTTYPGYSPYGVAASGLLIIELQEN
jgi:hypothetical protein